MSWLLVLHGILALLLLPAARVLGRRVFLLGAVAPAATAVWAFWVMPSTLDGEVRTERIGWVPDLAVALDLRLDAFSLVMVLMVSVIGVMVFTYSAWYFSDRPGIGGFAAILLAFGGSMLGLVLAENLFCLFVFWELTGVTSYLLIGYDSEKAAARTAALQAFLVTGVGALAMLAGFVLLGLEAGTADLSAILADPPSGGTVTPALALILAGAFTKSAQFPFHFWLPGAMAAPTPVSAYLHSATMVTAGVYLVGRLAPAFVPTEAWFVPTVVVVSCLTIVVGAYRALRQFDLKLLLAFSTVSQLGMMMMLFGFGVPEATVAGVTLLVAHALFKAALFMVVGVVDHQAHTRDLRRLHDLRRRLPVTFVVAVVGTLSMAGIPPLLGFIAKETAFEALLHADPRGWATLSLVVFVTGSIVTFAYGARLLWGAFGPLDPVEGHEPVDPAGVPRPVPALLAAPLLLAAAGLVFGVAPALVDAVVVDGAVALDPGAAGKTLALWHGFNAALALSAFVIVAGLGLFALRRRVEGVQGAVPRLVSAREIFGASLNGLYDGSRMLTAVVQNGSLPAYLGITLVTLLALPGTALVLRTDLTDPSALAASPLQAAAAGLVIAAALATAIMRRRMAAVILLGAVGFGVAVVFVIQGAPDLALTQLLVETVTLVVFVLVLRRLPDRFPRRPRWTARRVARLVLSVGVGCFVGFAALAVGTTDLDTSVSGEYVARAEPEGEGKNIVNVILTDFRSLDTLGEVVVLAVAAIGIGSLVRITLRGGRTGRRAGSDGDPTSAQVPIDMASEEVPV